MVALPSYFSIIVTLIALVMIIFCVIKGFKDGLVLSIFDLLALLVSLYVAYVCSGTLAVDLAIIPNSVTSGLTIVSNEIFNDMITMVINYFINWIIWFLIISIGLRIVLHFIRKLFKGINKIPVVKTINEYAGAIFGLVKAMIMIMIMALTRPNMAPAYSLMVLTTGILLIPLNNLRMKCKTIRKPMDMIKNQMIQLMK